MKTIILVRSLCEGLDPSDVLGVPGQGIQFLKRAIWPVLNAIGEPVGVGLDADLRAICQNYREAGRPVVLCHFGLPLSQAVEPGCPCFYVFPWAFADLPPEAATWRAPLARSEGVITFSQQAADAIRTLMGNDFPVLVSAAQPWERFAALAPDEGLSISLAPRTLDFRGQLLDSPSIGLCVDGLARVEPPSSSPLPQEAPVAAAQPLAWRRRLAISRTLLRDWWNEAVVELLRPRPTAAAMPAPPRQVPDGCLPAIEQKVRLHGVIFTCVLSAEDPSRNWTEMLTAFCWTFRDQPDATLVFKLTHSNLSSGRIAMLTNLSRLSPFQCRVVVINAHLEDTEYARLVAASHYLVHPAQSEGSALTVQEFMSAGRPVLAPRHSALCEWIGDDHPFLIRSAEQPAYWVQDADKRLHLRDHRLDWTSMCEVFARAFAVAMENAQRYRQLSRAAREAARERCDRTRLADNWRQFLAPRRTDAQPVALQVGAGS
jgi:hypothetical protein